MKTKSFILTAFVGGLVGGGIASPVLAQQGQNLNLEEILVTGRKRTESLTDVPVSISVMNQEFIGEAGILDTVDMFDAAVGFEYDTGWGDRNTANPGIRGVQGNGYGVTQQKMNSFLDGFPLVGQQGSLQFDDVASVEMYRGPQSAAFGRATFAGAINYVSRNPTEEFEAEISAGVSDLGRSEVHLALAGPISDTLGYTLDLSTDEFDGPDEWTSTDGYRMGSTSTDYASAKLVWDPTDDFTAKLRYIRHRADDRPGNLYYLEAGELAACANTTVGSGANYYQGDVSGACDLSVPANGIPRSHNLAELAGLDESDPAYDFYLGYSILDPYARDERDRYQLELDYSIGDSMIQILAMYSEEYFEAWQDGDYTDGVPVVTPNAGTGLYQPFSRALVSNMSNPYNLTEDYYEVRWVSPAEDRLSYVAGISHYEADVPGIGSWETAGHRLGLDGNAVIGRDFKPASVYGEEIYNTGVFANLTYDLTDQTTLTAEARYQTDKVANRNSLEGNKLLTSETSSFQPRISLTHSLSDNLTAYGQLSQGTNPAGVNIGYTFDAVQDGIALANAAGHVSYQADDLSTYDEETLTNFEVGLKGTAFDDKLSFSTAFYALKWENQTNVFTVDWDDTDPGGWNEAQTFSNISQRTTLNQGTIKNKGIEFEGSYFLTDAWTVNGNFSVIASEYDSFCDVLISGGNFGIAANGTDAQTGADCVVMDGNTPPFLSQSSWALGLAYRSAINNSDWNLSGRLDLRHAGEQYMDTANIMKLGARDLLNGSISISNDVWTTRLYVNNIMDDDLPRAVTLGRDASSGVISNRPYNLLVAPTRPREMGVSVSYKF